MKFILPLRRACLCITLASLPISLSQSSAWGQGVTETIVKTGDSVPDGDGTYELIVPLNINESGQIGFFSLLSNTSESRDTGYFRGTGGVVTQITREGLSIPSGNEKFGHILFQPNRVRMNDSGTIGFTSGLTDASGEFVNNAIFRSDGSGVSEVVRSGEIFPNGFIAFIPGPGNRPIGINNLGQIVFTTLSNSGAYRESAGVLEVVVEAGTAAPEGNGGRFDRIFNVSINDVGQAAFTGFISGNTDGVISGIYREVGGSITPIVNNLEPAPDGNGNFSAVTSSVRWFLNSAGQVGFMGDLENTSGSATDNVGIFLGDGVRIKQIVREGQAAPDGNGIFGQFLSIKALNDSGQVAFSGILDGTSDEPLFGASGGVYHGDGETITQIVRNGDIAPDGNGTVLLSSGGVALSINNAGLVGMNCRFIVDAEGTPVLNEAILLGDGTDLLQIAREGDPLGGSTIESVSMVANSLNSSGQLAYLATLENGCVLLQRWTPDLIWQATENGDWSDSSQWTLGLIPSAAHDVSLDSDLDVEVNGAATATVNSLEIGRGSGMTTLNLPDGSSLMTVEGLSVFANGTINVDAGANVTLGGDVEQNGSLVIPGNGATNSTVLINGVFSGQQGFRGGGRLLSTGGLRIGNSPASVLMEGDLILEDTAESEFEFAGVDIGEFDQLVVAGDLTLGGDLTIIELDGFGFESGQEFIIADVAELLTGRFTGLDEGALVGNFNGTDLFISYAAGDGNDVSLFTAPAGPLLGDVTGDGIVNFLDIAPFIALLSGNGFQNEADIDQNGFVNFLDIAPFIEILSS